MEQGSRDPYDWSDDDLFGDQDADHHDIALSGLPASWHHYRWWTAGLAFSVLWMLESWTANGSLPGPTGMLRLSLSFLSLLLTLGFSWTIYQFCKPHSRALGQAACILGAAALFYEYAG